MHVTSEVVKQCIAGLGFLLVPWSYPAAAGACCQTSTAALSPWCCLKQQLMHSLMGSSTPRSMAVPECMAGALESAVPCCFILLGDI